MRHKHFDLIMAWANGAKIQVLLKNNGSWNDCLESPAWLEDYAYRIKPEPKPDVVKYMGFLHADGLGNAYIGARHYMVYHWTHQLKLTFDGETGKLKSAEVLK